ncbi:hypothetical protein FA13DRAFT_1713869 [Coprinellus micaceus]|uniref:Uncharacterized protein n=1 Tax=Coprinellus micaceus TaxID=71717 RepID=A0A4Y7SUT6_COPMI|nr:hypothetical protein FA13DRAFT_1713869 [Coprinellus micaceus]
MLVFSLGRNPRCVFTSAPYFQSSDLVPEGNRSECCHYPATLVEFQASFRQSHPGSSRQDGGPRSTVHIKVGGRTRTAMLWLWGVRYDQGAASSFAGPASFIISLPGLPEKRMISFVVLAAPRADELDRRAALVVNAPALVQVRDPLALTVVPVVDSLSSLKYAQLLPTVSNRSRKPEARSWLNAQDRGMEVGWWHLVRRKGLAAVFPFFPFCLGRGSKGLSGSLVDGPLLYASLSLASDAQQLCTRMDASTAQSEEFGPSTLVSIGLAAIALRNDESEILFDQAVSLTQWDSPFNVHRCAITLCTRSLLQTDKERQEGVREKTQGRLDRSCATTVDNQEAEGGDALKPADATVAHHVLTRMVEEWGEVGMNIDEATQVLTVDHACPNGYKRSMKQRSLGDPSIFVRKSKKGFATMGRRD